MGGVGGVTKATPPCKKQKVPAIQRLFNNVSLVLQTKPPGRGVENRKFPKVVTRECKRSFGSREQKASCTGAK